jgi:hypothetical protein
MYQSKRQSFHEDDDENAPARLFKSYQKTQNLPQTENFRKDFGKNQQNTLSSSGKKTPGSFAKTYVKKSHHRSDNPSVNKYS